MMISPWVSLIWFYHYISQIPTTLILLGYSHIDGLEQDCSNSISDGLDFTKPLILNFEDIDIFIQIFITVAIHWKHPVIHLIVMHLFDVPSIRRIHPSIESIHQIHPSIKSIHPPNPSIHWIHPFIHHLANVYVSFLWVPLHRCYWPYYLPSFLPLIFTTSCEESLKHRTNAYLSFDFILT